MESTDATGLFDQFYYTHGLGQPYERNEAWLGFFGGIAERIISDIGPGSVLDAGCALGLLVESFRTRNVEAFGIDVSEYAVTHAHESIRPYCWVGSIADPLPRRYDLIVSIEVLEHIAADQATQAIANLCQHTDDILFSSSPFDYKEVTHFNVQPPEYWAEQFARHGFYRDVDFDATFITAWAVRFRKTAEPMHRVTRNYERRYWTLNKENYDLRLLSVEMRTQLVASDEAAQQAAQQLADREKQVSDIEQRLADDEQVMGALQARLAEREQGIEALQARLAEREQGIEALQARLAEREQSIEALQARLAEREQSIEALASQVQALEESLCLLTQQLNTQTQAAQDLAAQLRAQNQALAAQASENEEARRSWAAREIDVQMLSEELRQALAWRSRLEQTPGWAILRALQSARGFLAPPNTVRDALLGRLAGTLHSDKFAPAEDATPVVAGPVAADAFSPEERLIDVDAVKPREPVHTHRATVDVIICVHNALADVQRCLESVLLYSSAPFGLILVDDGSESETCGFLQEFAGSHTAELIRNETARGYTRAANQGLHASNADYAVLLNSDTLVPPGWLDRMVACAESNPGIGIVGPLSNTASWQSIPELIQNDDWAANQLPEGTTAARMGELVAQHSGRVYPTMPLLNGFCLMLRRKVIETVGYFDEETFGDGYGEEDDFALRARKAGWSLALADDVYVYHAQSRSYSNERRRALSERAVAALNAKHDPEVIVESCRAAREDRVLQGIRAQSRVLAGRQQCVAEGKAHFAGRRLLFVLPVAEPGGGANVIITEAHALQQMGVDVTFFNLEANRPQFVRSYPALDIPVIFGQVHDVPDLASGFDAAIATVNFTVEWLSSVKQDGDRLVRGYYVQGFEPYIYTPETPDYQKAWASYALLPDLVRFTKTEWTRQQVVRHIGVDCAIVGPSLDIDLYRPRPSTVARWPLGALRVAAMIRPNTPCREPGLTMDVLRRVAQRFGGEMQTVIFGASPQDPGLASLPHDFDWRCAGILTPAQVARLMNDVDIFVDFSSHQAMGLTALEAMACGAAAAVPSNGGAMTFARHEKNSLVVDTSSVDACVHALERLIQDHDLRQRVQQAAIADVVEYYPERAALKILAALFSR